MNEIGIKIGWYFVELVLTFYQLSKVGLNMSTFQVAFTKMDFWPKQPVIVNIVDHVMAVVSLFTTVWQWTQFQILRPGHCFVQTRHWSTLLILIIKKTMVVLFKHRETPQSSNVTFDISHSLIVRSTTYDRVRSKGVVSNSYLIDCSFVTNASPSWRGVHKLNCTGIIAFFSIIN